MSEGDGEEQGDEEEGDRNEGGGEKRDDGIDNEKRDWKKKMCKGVRWMVCYCTRE
jgi:hypothetical protein